MWSLIRRILYTRTSHSGSLKTDATERVKKKNDLLISLLHFCSFFGAIFGLMVLDGTAKRFRKHKGKEKIQLPWNGITRKKLAVGSIRKCYQIPSWFCLISGYLLTLFHQTTHPNTFCSFSPLISPCRMS